MSQSEFLCLAVIGDSFETLANTPTMDAKAHTHEVLGICVGKQSSDQTCVTGKDIISINADKAVNFIPDEVYAIIAEQKSSKLTRKSPSDESGSMDFDVTFEHATKEIFEPVRRIRSFNPPKVFYRTPTSRRILALSSAQTN